MKVLCLVTEKTLTHIESLKIKTYQHKVVEAIDVRFDENNGSQREHVAPVLDEMSAEESIKLKATKDIIPTEEPAKEVISNNEDFHAGAHEGNGAEENA